MKVLDVGRKSILKSSSDLVPLSETSGAALQGWAKKIYAKLTGEQSSGTLVVKLANAERGTILIDGQEKGNINNGSGTVNGLSEGKYRLSVESEGFRRWEKDVTVTGGKTESISAELERGFDGGGGIGTGGGSGGGGGGGGGGPSEGGERGNGMWKGISIGAVAVTAGGIGMALYGNSLRSDARNKLCDGGAYHAVDPSCPEMAAMPLDEASVNDLNDRGDRGKMLGRVGAGIAVVSGGFAMFAIYKGFIAKSSSSSKEHASRGQRVRRERFVLTPIVSPQGGGATLRIDW
ncbi:MAG: PEGA domain-containing protein [Kofleriaceae bacterium]|nr:PEGA domain-containing protein [Kofleriaceae bacterium]